MMKKLIKFSAIPVLAVAFSAPALATPKSYVVDPTHSFASMARPARSFMTPLPRPVR